jgi:N-acetylmuramoyl-L-alanine amidase
LRLYASRTDKGVKRASLWVLWRTYMPSVLTEIGYLTNLEEERFLGSPKGQDYVASSLFKAFREYKDEIEGDVKKYDDEIEKREPYKITKEDSVAFEKLPNKEEAADTSASKTSHTNKIEVKEAKEPKEVKVVPATELKTKVEPAKPTNISDVKSNDKHKTEEPIKATVYKVQLMSSDKKIPLNSDKFKNVEKPGEYQEKGIFKYTAGECSNKQDAINLQNKLRKSGFKDAFVIAMQDGKRIPLK